MNTSKHYSFGTSGKERARISKKETLLTVLLKDNQAKRNQWPTGLITKTFPGEDGLVRKVQVEIVKDGTRKTFSRPVTEVILLLSPKTDSVN